jgi:hypothetical protein
VFSVAHCIPADASNREGTPPPLTSTAKPLLEKLLILFGGEIFGPASVKLRHARQRMPMPSKPLTLSLRVTVFSNTCRSVIRHDCACGTAEPQSNPVSPRWRQSVRTGSLRACRQGVSDWAFGYRYLEFITASFTAA